MLPAIMMKNDSLPCIAVAMGIVVGVGTALNSAAQSTSPAGNLVLTGELTGDFVVFDARRGDVLYRFNTGGPMGGGVVTYATAGRQYIAVASGSPSNFWNESNPGSPTIVVFALPR